MPERDPILQPEPTERSVVRSPDSKPRADSNGDDLTPLEPIDTAEPLYTEKQAWFRGQIAQILDAHDTSKEAGIKRAAAEIQRLILRLVWRHGKNFDRKVAAAGKQYLTNPNAKVELKVLDLGDTIRQQALVKVRTIKGLTKQDEEEMHLWNDYDPDSKPPRHPNWRKAHCILLTDQGALVQCSYLWNPSDNNKRFRVNWGDRTSPPELWITYGNKIVDILATLKE